MNIKKYIECQLEDAEIEEERLVAAVEKKKEDESELDKIDATIDAYQNILRYIKQNPDERVLWQDVGVGQETKIGDRCYGFNGWFTLDHAHVEAQPIVPDGAKPIQRLIK